MTTLQSVLQRPPSLRILRAMTRPEAIQQIRDAAKTIALQMMKIHPALPALQDSETMADSLKALHEMTVNLEIIKKKIGRLERQDDSTLL